MKRYPKTQNQKLDPISRRRFDKYEENIKNGITFDNNAFKYGLTKKAIDVLAFNCAFLVLIDKD